MDALTDFDKFSAPCISFSDLAPGMGEKVAVGDTIIARNGPEEATADVVEIDKEAGKIYLTKDLPEGSDFSVDETATGGDAPYDAIKKAAVQTPSKDVLTGPLPGLKKILIQLSIEEGQ